MANNMPIFVEVWPVAADKVAIWLLSELTPWTSGPLQSDNEPHAEVEYVLSQHELLDNAALIHSTSWRVEENYLLLTYMVVVHAPQLIVDAWPNAKPIGVPLAEHVGPTIPYQPADAPIPRHIDVLLHGLRHLKFLSETDATNVTVFTPSWLAHLKALSPALAGMYSDNIPK